MAGEIFQNKVSLFVMPNGKQDGRGTGLSVLSIDKHSMTGKTDATIPGRGQDYGYDQYGRIRVKNTFQEAPGGLLTASMEFDKRVEIDYMEKRRVDQAIFGIWEMASPCGRRDNPNAWLSGGRLDYHGKVTISGYSGGDAPARDGSATPVVASVDLTWEYDIVLRPLAGASVTPEIATNQEMVTSIFGLKEPLVPGCSPGYRGPDQHLFITSQADVAAAPEVHFSTNGGSTWTVITANPFSVAEHISDGAVAMVGGSTARVIIGNGVGTLGMEISYADVVFGNEAASTWTEVTVAAVPGDIVNRVAWLFYNAVYISAGTTADDIWVSTDQGATWTLQYTGAGDQINAFAKGYGQDCEDVYAVGETNLILVDRGRTGTWSALVGPAGGGDFTAIAIDNVGDIFAGNGDSLYVSTNKAASAAGWTLMKDFGLNHVVKDIFFPKGDSMHIYVVVDDTTPGLGEFWHSNDGGNNWTLVTEVAGGAGYNRGYKSDQDDNLYYAVGDVGTGTYGEIHRFTPSSSGC